MDLVFYQIAIFCIPPLPCHNTTDWLKGIKKERNSTNLRFFFCGIQLFLGATILSHRYGSGETMVESHASSDPQPNQAALLLNTARIRPGSQPHQCVGGNTVHLATLVSAHCARPASGVAGAWWDKAIPPGQTLPNPDDARPIVRCPTDLPVSCDRAWAQTQSLRWHS